MKNKLSLTENEHGTFNPNMKVSKNPAPKKMALATAFLEEYVAAQKEIKTKGGKKQVTASKLSTLQKELLDFYCFEPSEKQMEQLKAYMNLLLIENSPQSKVEQIGHTAA
jgi:hypothetical protein